MSPFFSNGASKTPSPIQPRLRIGARNDRFEQEADRVADRLVGVPEVSPLPITHLPPARLSAPASRRPPESEDQPVRTKPAGPPTPSPRTAALVQGLRGGGAPLPAGTRRFFEQGMGHDFRGVRVHTGAAGQEASRRLGARAFTSGRDVAFAAGEYAPATREGRRLLAHELTHVVQQLAGAGGQIRRQPTDPRVADCLADRDRLLPGGVGLLTHMMRETQLADTLGDERPMLEAQIRVSEAARRFVCEAGVPAMIALYDTRRAQIQLEVDCARRALRSYPAHYRHAALGQRRHHVLPPAFTSFRRRTPLFRSETARTRIADLDPGRRLQLLAPTPRRGRYHVRMISGPRHCEEGYVPAAQLVTPTTASMTAPRRVRLVFMENPERIGRTIFEVGAGITSRQTRLRVPQPGRADRYHRIPPRRKFYLESAHTATELNVNMYVGATRKSGFLPRADTMNDLDFRRSERRFFVQVAGTIARDRSSIFVDPQSQSCLAEPVPIEFFTGQDIVRAIVGAANCTDALVDEIHIVGHGGTHGMPGTGDFAHYTGLYVQNLQSRIEERSGALTARAFVRAASAALANGVQVWIHACKTAENYADEVAATATSAAQPRIPGFAEQLAGELRGSGHSRATVGALPGRGPANAGYVRRKRFVIYPGGARQFIEPVR